MGKEEAIREIKRFMSIIPNDMQEAIMVLVPELAESEDERIRKSLLAYIKGESKRLDTPKWISYLEKQKEYELTEEDKKIIPEALIMLCDDIINHRVHTPIKTDEGGARKIKAFLKTFNRQPHKTREEWEKQKEQKPWSEEDEKNLKSVVSTLWFALNTPHFPLNYERIIELEGWLKSLRPQPKQVWTEEDDRICHLIMANLSESARHAITLPMETVEHYSICLRFSLIGTRKTNHYCQMLLDASQWCKN